MKDHCTEGLRYYQAEAHRAIYESWRENRAVLALMATGLGKTQVFCTVAKNWDGTMIDPNPQPWMKRVLVLAHRDELVQQAHNRMTEITQDYVGLEQASFHASGERYVVGSTQSVFQPKRLERMMLTGGFGLVIVDEAHHYVSAAFRRPLDAMRQSKVLGVTATADRGDERALGMIFDDTAYSFDIEDGIDAGYLVPIPVGRDIRVKQIDLSRVKTSGGDLAIGQLDEAIQEATEGICAGLLEHFPDRKGPVFFPGKASAKLGCEVLNRYNPGSACVITEDTPPDTRREIIRGIREGRYQWFCNCMVATEGFDWPEANVVGLARPTKSRSLFTQMVGRGTRPLPGVLDGIDGIERAAERRAAIAASAKPDCMIANFVGNAGKHQLVTLADALGGNYRPAVIKKAKLLERDNPEMSMIELLKQAERELKALAASTRAKVETEASEYNPFAVFGLSDDGGQKRARWGAKPVSWRQQGALWSAGIEDVVADRHQASKLLDELNRRRNMGLATYAQMKQLRRWGVTQNDIPFEAAKKAMTYLQQTGWGKRRSVDPSALRSLLGTQE